MRITNWVEVANKTVTDKIETFFTKTMVLCKDEQKFRKGAGENGDGDLATIKCCMNKQT